MATSGTINNTFRTGYAIRIVWTVDSQSVANNTSTVTAKVQLVSLGASYTINSSTSKTGTLTINGTAYSFDFTAALTGNQTKTICTKTVTVAHGTDGSKSCAFSCSAGINVTLSGTYYGKVSASGKGTFNTIARATIPTVSASSVNMGASITINMPRAASSFVHTLTYKLGSATGTIGSNLGTSQAWTVPLSLASQIPNATSGTCTITCQTYSGTSLVGTKTVSFTAVVPSSVVPTFSSVLVADTNTSYATQFVSLVQNKSAAKFTINAVGAYGSTIKAYKTVIEGKTYTGATPTTAVLTTSGNVTAKVTVTDSRGRTATVDKTFWLIPYTPPQITVFNCFRSNASGVADYEGQCASISVSYSVATANNKNTVTYKLEKRKNGDSTWEEVSKGNSFTLTENIVTGAIFSPDNAFDIKVTLKDYFTTVTRTIEIPTAFTLLDFNASGRGIAFGKVSEFAEAVEFALPVYFDQVPIINGGSKILWSGGWFMTETHKITLAEPVTDQLSGIVLVWSRYADGVAQEAGFNSFFIPKAFIDIKRGYGHTFILSAGNTFSFMAAKYLYINNEYITGNASNNAKGTANGITYDNSAFILRYVIGV